MLFCGVLSMFILNFCSLVLMDWIVEDEFCPCLGSSDVLDFKAVDSEKADIGLL
jgi:hypothetical protein